MLLLSCDDSKTQNKTAAAHAHPRAEYRNKEGARIKLISPTECEVSFGAETYAGTHTREADAIRIVYDRRGSKTERLYYETKYGLIGNSLEDTYVTESGMSLLDKYLLTARARTPMERNIGQLSSYIQIYATKNNGRPPSAAAGLRALISKRILTDEGILTDPWGEPVEYELPAIRSRDKFDIFSKGSDKIAGNEDDIGNWPGSHEGDPPSQESPELNEFSETLKGIIRKNNGMLPRP